MQSFKSKLFQNENNMRDVKDILDEAQESMDMAIMYLDEALAHIRAGKADIRLLDGIRVDSYGSMVPINNVAAVTTPDARSIAIKPWDKSMFRVIEKAIIDSSLGIIEQLSKTYISTLWADAIVFGVLVLVLVVKPTGLLGKTMNEKV